MADNLIASKPYRYSTNFTATAEETTYEVTPITGRPMDSYLAIVNSGDNDLNIAFGSEDDMGDYFVISPSGSFEPLAGFFTRGSLVMSITGTTQFTIIR